MEKKGRQIFSKIVLAGKLQGINNTADKDLTFAHPLFTASCSRMNSPVNQTNHFFICFLSDSVEITSCEHTETIIHLRLS